MSQEFNLRCSSYADNEFIIKREVIMRKILGFIFLALFVLTIQNIKAQTPTAAAVKSGIRATNADGEVSAINKVDKKINLQTGDGAIEVVVTESTGFKKVQPGSTNIATATDVTIEEIGEKDKILVTGKVSEDKKTITAKNVYLMTQTDINKRNQAERELWRTRGINGKVVSVDFKTQAITISTPARGMMPGANVVISPKENAQYLRYAPDSVKYSDAVGSSLAEIKVGDEIRALGDRSTDGLTFKAEKYLSGSFRVVTGKVTAVDVAKNEVTIENTQDKKPVIITLKSNTMIKRFPAEVGQMMAMAMSGGGMMMAGGQGGQGGSVTMRPPQGGGQPNGQTPPQVGGNPPAGNGQTPTNGQTGQGAGRQMGRGAGGGSLDDMIANLPNLTISDIKVGETIGISTTPGTIPTRFTAIKFIAGIEPFLNMPQRPMGGGGGGNNQPSFNIPGLDGGIGNP